MRNRYVVWGYGRSWIVHEVGADGRIVWASEWRSTQVAAENLRDEITSRI